MSMGQSRLGPWLPGPKLLPQHEEKGGGRSGNDRDTFYMAHFPQMLGTATFSNQGLPLAVLQAGFGPEEERAAQMMPKPPRVAPGAEFLLPSPHTPGPLPASAACGCIAANPPRAGLILIA